MLYRHVPIEAIPQCLRERPQWICWKYVPRENGEPGKLPVQAEKGWNASTTDANTWSTFDVAVQAYQKNKAYAGIAYVFAESDPFAGIDLDDCLDDDGEFIWGEDIVESFDTYSEVSPSGRGIKLIFEGKKPQWANCIVNGLGPDGNVQIEIYDRARCFTITGQRLVSSPTGVASRQSELDALCAKLWGLPPDTTRPPHLRPCSRTSRSSSRINE